jgi:hypothetical protein
VELETLFYFLFLSVVKHILFPVFMFHPLFLVSFHVGAGDPVVVCTREKAEYLMEEQTTPLSNRDCMLLITPPSIFV